MAYPHPSPSDPVQKSRRRPQSSWTLPPPSQEFTGLQGEEWPPKPGVKIHGFPNHAGGYWTTPAGLNIAGHPWDVLTKTPELRQQRSDNEAMIASYWVENQEKFGPQGDFPSNCALVT